MAALAPSVPKASRHYFWQEYPPLVVVAIAWILGIFIIAALADLIAPYTYTALDRAGWYGTAFTWHRRIGA